MTNHIELKLTIYGLSPKSCDTIKNAYNWPEKQGVAYQFQGYVADWLEVTAATRLCRATRLAATTKHSRHQLVQAR
jgi:arsenate reductase-like glutaredoxin family protein